MLQPQPFLAIVLLAAALLALIREFHTAGLIAAGFAALACALHVSRRDAMAALSALVSGTAGLFALRYSPPFIHLLLFCMSAAAFASVGVRRSRTDVRIYRFSLQLLCLSLAVQSASSRIWRSGAGEAAATALGAKLSLRDALSGCRGFHAETMELPIFDQVWSSTNSAHTWVVVASIVLPLVGMVLLGFRGRIRNSTLIGLALASAAVIVLGAEPTTPALVAILALHIRFFGEPQSHALASKATDDTVRVEVSQFVSGAVLLLIVVWPMLHSTLARDYNIRVDQLYGLKAHTERCLGAETMVEIAYINEDDDETSRMQVDVPEQCPKLARELDCFGELSRSDDCARALAARYPDAGAFHVSVLRTELDRRSRRAMQFGNRRVYVRRHDGTLSVSNFRSQQRFDAMNSRSQ